MDYSFVHICMRLTIAIITTKINVVLEGAKHWLYSFYYA